MPRPRPIKIGCGNLYVSVNADEQGICEVFTNTGRAGGCASQSEATARLISIALRSGLSVDAIIEQVRGIRCPACVRREGVNVTSCPDAISRVIKKYRDVGSTEQERPVSFSNSDQGFQDLSETLREFSVAVENSGEHMKNIRVNGLSKQIQTGVAVDQACPECGMPVNHESGCVVCRHCGFSKCG